MIESMLDKCLAVYLPPFGLKLMNAVVTLCHS